MKKERKPVTVAPNFYQIGNTCLSGITCPRGMKP